MGKASSSASSATTTYANSFNRSTTLTNVGNVSFGDDAIKALAGSSNTFDKLLPWALALAGLFLVLSFFRGGAK